LVFAIIMISCSSMISAEYPVLPNCCDVTIAQANENQDIIGSDGNTYNVEAVEEKIESCQSAFKKIYDAYNLDVDKCCVDGKASVFVGRFRRYNGYWYSVGRMNDGCQAPNPTELNDYYLEPYYSITGTHYNYNGLAPAWLVSMYSKMPASPSQAASAWDQENCQDIDSFDKFVQCMEQNAADTCWAPAFFGVGEYNGGEHLANAAYGAMSICATYLNDYVKVGVVTPKSTGAICTDEENGCCAGYIMTKHKICCREGDISYLTETGPTCLPADTFPRYVRTEITLGKKIMNLDGDDRIPVTFKFIGTDENNNELPMQNYRVPFLYAKAENNAFMGDIIGNTKFKFDMKNGEFQYTNEQGEFHTEIYADDIELGSDAKNMDEAKIYVYTWDTKEINKKSFSLKIPKMTIKKIWKSDPTRAARPGAYSKYTIEFDDPGNLEKTIYITAAGGTFYKDGKETKGSKIKLITRENSVPFRWTPPEMSMKFRVNQLKVLHKNILKLQDNYKKHYIDTADGHATDFLKGKMNKNVVKSFDVIDKVKTGLEHVDNTVKTVEQMKQDYYKMFEHDTTFTEQLTRGFLMTTDAYEITDGTISLITDSDDDLAGLAKSQAINALKESLRNELKILEAAKGKEFGKSFTLNVKVEAGGAIASQTVRLRAEAPVMTYEAS